MPTIETAIKQTKFDNDLVKVNVNILFTANWIYNRVSAQLKPFQITHEQFNVLRILRGQHPNCLCQKEILERMIAPNSNLTLILKKLITKKLIQLAQSTEDKRAYRITITEAGLALLERIDEAFKIETEQFNKLTPSEAFHLNALLDKLRAD
ncbi:MAG: MarR family transcriptional regulator [Bacteroidota bacterium]